MTELTPDQVSRLIEHTLLKPAATEADIRRTCRDAARLGCCAAVVNPIWVETAREELDDSGVRIVTVAGFPLGAHRTEFKTVEAVRGAIDGAAEIDMVAHIGWLAGGETIRAEREIAEVRRALPAEIVLKVIIEASLLTDEQQAEATRAVVAAGAQFVKTSTGFFGGATIEQVRTLTRAAGGEIGVKAAGGIRTLEQCRTLVRAGADRIGTSASVKILA